ncbi:MAG TPA: hypothetical protein VGB00_12610 [Pyrinomonadaceae bacterium]|jgi:hypothetical protein
MPVPIVFAAGVEAAVAFEGQRAIDDELFGVIPFMAATPIAPPFIRIFFAAEFCPNVFRRLDER